MAVNVFGIFLIFSFLFSCINSYKNITEDEFGTFKGIDVAATCGSAQSMQDMCNQIGKKFGTTDGNKAFRNGYPTCVDKDIQLQKTGCQELVKKMVKLLVCSWEGDTIADYYTKGQGPNHVMNYNCDVSSCVPFNDLKVK